MFCSRQSRRRSVKELGPSSNVRAMDFAESADLEFELLVDLLLDFAADFLEDFLEDFFLEDFFLAV